MIRRFMRVVAPDLCIVCGRESKLLHDDCTEEMEAAPPSCIVCGALSKDYRLCSPCRKTTGMDTCYFFSTSDSPARRLISSAKYSSNKDACTAAAALMGEISPDYLDEFGVTHVPSAYSRVRERGFDHAAVVAHELASRKQLASHQLLRRVGTSKQVGSSRAARLRQAKEQYAIAASRVVPERILLVDDIYTTGATLTACTKLLKQAGAKHVYGAVLIRSK
ncbi:MAG: phosphoribosyltransferase family protein [Patescibacteria group bacterium]